MHRLTWWRAITQYLLRPGTRLLGGLASSLARIKLLHTATATSASSPPTQLLRATEQSRVEAARKVGFADRFAAGVARWAEVQLDSNEPAIR